MVKRLYVGNLPYSAEEDEPRRLFGQAGTVESVDMPLDRLTGRSRGFAFIQMATDEDAEAAIRKFNGYRLDNRSLRVNMAEERERRERQPVGHPARRR
jgi:RNA recognition motif-containing protein